MASVVMRSICALYTVSAGSTATCDTDAGTGVGIGERENDECLGLGGVIGLGDGRGVPDCLGGIRRRRPAGKRRRTESSAGLVAKSVMDSRSGKTRMSHAVGKWICLDDGKREMRAE